MTTLNNSFVEKILSEFVCIVFCLLKTTANNYSASYPMLHNGIMTVKKCVARYVYLPYFFFAMRINPCCPYSLIPFIFILLFDVVLLINLHICTMRYNFLSLSEFRFVQMLCRYVHISHLRKILCVIISIMLSQRLLINILTNQYTQNCYLLICALCLPCAFVLILQLLYLLY